MTEDGRTVITLSKDATARVWDVQQGICKHILQGHTDGISSGCLSRDGSILSTYSYDRMIKLWRVETGECLVSIPVEESVTIMELSPGGEKLAVALSNERIILFDMSHPERSMMIAAHTEQITGLSFSNDGGVLATCSLDCTVKVFDSVTGRLDGVFVSDCGLTCCHYDEQSGVIVAGSDRGVVNFISCA